MSHSFKTKYCDQKDTKMKVLKFRKIQDTHLLSLEHSCHPFLAFSVLCLNQLLNHDENVPSKKFQMSKYEENIWIHKSRLDFAPSAKVLPSPGRKNCLGCFLMFVEIVQISSEVVLKSSQSQDQVVNRTAEYHSSAKIVFCTFLFHHFFFFTNLINKVEIRHNFCTFFALSHLLVPQLSEKLVEIKFASNLKVGRV